MSIIDFPKKEDEEMTLLKRISESLKANDLLDYPAEHYVLVALADDKPMALLTSSPQDFYYLVEVSKLSLMVEMTNDPVVH
jgi:hypothetical protein